MIELDYRVLMLRRMALLCVILVLTVTTLSAFMRLSKAGLGCTDWPACYAVHADVVESVASTPITISRALHRLSAVTVLILALTMAATCWMSRPLRRRDGLLAIGLILLALFLAVLGRYTPGARMPAVAIGNVLGGFAMLALAWQIWRPPTVRSASRLRPLAVFVVLLLLAQIALGVLVSAGFAGLSCTGFPACGSVVDTRWFLLDPWRVPEFIAGDAFNPQGAFAHMLHRGLALLVAIATLALSQALWQRGDRAIAASLLALLALQFALGIAMVLLSLPLPIAVLHNVVAALMLALSAGQLRSEGAHTAG